MAQRLGLDWSFLNGFNPTAAKGWSIVWLWIFTGAVWGLCSLLKITMDVAIFTAWLGGLAAYSAVGAYSQANHRATDWELNRIKAGASQPTNVNVSAGQAQVNATGTEGKP